MSYLFDENWFNKYQKKLLWLLNTPLIKIWFRWVLRIRKEDCSLKTGINRIAPNNFTFNEKTVLVDHIRLKSGWVIYDRYNQKHQKLRNKCKIEKRLAVQKTTDFRTHNKFSKRLFHAFYPVWWIAHQWDTLFANRFQPAWNLGFDTLTVYPDAHTETNTVDGVVIHAQNLMTWANLVAAAGNYFIDDSTTAYWCEARAGSNNNTWQQITRGILLFKTSDLTADAVISAATLSIYGDAGNLKNDPFSATPDINIYSSAPASDTALANGDYDSLGSTAFATAITYANWAANYNVFTFNATGIAAISKTGISKFGTRNANHDVANSAPTWATGGVRYYLSGYTADYTGTTKDPKLVVTYSTSEAFTQTCSESLSLTQAFSKSQGFKKSTSESLSLTQSFSKKVGFKKSISDSTSGLTDAISSVRCFAKELTENLSLSDAVSKVQGLYQTLTESLSLSSLMDRTTNFIKSFSENIGLTDALSSSRIWFANLIENISLTDLIEKVNGYAQTLTESLSLSSLVEKTTSYFKELNDSIGLTDYISNTWLKILNLIESISLSDTLGKTANFIKSFSDGIGLTGTMQRTAKFFKSIKESLSLSSSISFLRKRFLAISENLKLTDSISKITKFFHSLTETVWLSDVVRFAGRFWNKLAKKTSSYTNQSKNSSSWSQATKSTASWNYKDKSP